MATKKIKSTVCILLCTYNGEKFLKKQLDSIALQTHQDWRVVASDDGSTDQTLDILLEYQKRWGVEKLEIRSGPQRGFAQNFLSLACDPSIKADYFAFCDQDDVWLPRKLSVALAHISENAASGQPYVYSGRVHYVSENLKLLGDSPLFTFPRSFRNVLVQSIAGGNTMVFNRDAKQLLEKTGMFDVASHDWWVYLLVKGAGGKVCYDPVPQILYRQHIRALIGSNNSFSARFERFIWLMLGRLRRWNTLHVNALSQIEHLLTPENAEIFGEFKRMRNSHIIHRFRMIEVCGLYRQGWRGSLSLYLAAIFNKI
jgi:glycosyltransferase involved in cell wall biosynthesis